MGALNRSKDYTRLVYVVFDNEMTSAPVMVGKEGLEAVDLEETDSAAEVGSASAAATREESERVKKG